MDYEDGEALSQLLQREKTLPEEQIRCLIGDILSALKAVHDQGYLHRDLKQPIFMSERINARF